MRARVTRVTPCRPRQVGLDDRLTPTTQRRPIPRTNVCVKTILKKDKIMRRMSLLVSRGWVVGRGLRGQAESEGEEERTATAPAEAASGNKQQANKGKAREKSADRKPAGRGGEGGCVCKGWSGVGLERRRHTKGGTKGGGARQGEGWMARRKGQGGFSPTEEEGCARTQAETEGERLPEQGLMRNLRAQTRSCNKNRSVCVCVVLCCVVVRCVVLCVCAWV